ncbi:hypothetical protein [Streptomyces zinciresistens]|nr:hypothetical protein [Streptomyces zinciresistens]
MRRFSAVVVLLVTSVLLHFATPHQPSAPPRPVTAQASVAAVETRKTHTPPPAVVRGGSAPQHHEAPADTVALVPRTDSPVPPPAVADDTLAVGTVAALPGVSGAPHARTARDAWNPGAAPAPTPCSLQTFRC